MRPQQHWDQTLTQMQSIRGNKIQKRFALICWQSSIYWIWQERNKWLHSQQFRSPDALLRLITRQITDRLLAYRFSPRRLFHLSTCKLGFWRKLDWERLLTYYRPFLGFLIFKYGFCGLWVKTMVGLKPWNTVKHFFSFLYICKPSVKKNRKRRWTYRDEEERCYIQIK